MARTSGSVAPSRDTSSAWAIRGGLAPELPRLASLVTQEGTMGHARYPFGTAGPSNPAQNLSVVESRHRTETEHLNE